MAGAGVAIAIAALAWFSSSHDDAAATQAASAAQAQAQAGRPLSGAAGQAFAPSAPAREQRRVQLVQQFQLADTTYCTYAGDTKYPPSSRPVGEHPDQIYPNAPVTEAHAMRTEGGGSASDGDVLD